MTYFLGIRIRIMMPLAGIYEAGQIDYEKKLLKNIIEVKN